MKKYIIIAAMLPLFASCDKLDTKPSNTTTQQPSEPEPDPCPTGKVVMVNNSSNPYDIFVNGAKDTQQPGKSKGTLTLAKGNYVIKVQQVSGYIAYPTVKEYNISLSGCDEKTISYP